MTTDDALGVLLDQVDTVVQLYRAFLKGSRQPEHVINAVKDLEYLWEQYLRDPEA